MEDRQEKDCSLLGNDTFPKLYDALVYERKFKSEYLERQIYERSLTSEPSIVKPCETYRESKRTLIKANFISLLKKVLQGNLDLLLKKFVFKKISTIKTPKSSKLHRYVNKVRKLYHARYKLG